MGGGTIAVAGAIAQRPGVGGHAWAFLQYFLGLRRLGWDVLFVDLLPGSASVDAAGRPCPVTESVQAAYLTRVMRDAGMGESFSLLAEDGTAQAGLSRADVVRRLHDADVLINVMGFLEDEELLAAPRRRIFLDIDPGYPQIWHDLSLADVLSGHDAYVTVGANVGREGCAIPDCGVEWVPTAPPVALDHWPTSSTGGDAYTTIASWRGPYGVVSYKGKTYGSRVHEFRRFARLPRAVDARLELALDIHRDETGDLGLLRRNGWRLRAPASVAADPAAYRTYIQGSRAEFCVAKNIYVETRSGWFSDRSACYLASGKPVLAQDTGFSSDYPTGEGVLAFSTLEEAVAGVEEIERDYARHARAAREIAEEYFAADKVLARLLERIGLGGRRVRSPIRGAAEARERAKIAEPNGGPVTARTAGVRPSREGEPC